MTAETVFDTGYGYEVSYRYLKAASSNIDTRITVGTIVASAIQAHGITIATSNTERPTITVSGEDFHGDTTGSKTYSSSLAVTGTKTAQTFSAFTVDTNSRAISSTATISTQLAKAHNATGYTAAMDVYQGRVEVSAELQSATAVASAAADTGFTLAGPVGNTEENTGYGSSSLTVFKNLT